MEQQSQQQQQAAPAPIEQNSEQPQMMYQPAAAPGAPMYAGMPYGQAPHPQMYGGYPPSPYGVPMMYQQAPVMMFPGQAPVNFIPQQQQQQPVVANPASDEPAKNEGDKSWAQIARDPDMANELNEKQEKVQQPQDARYGVVSHADHRNWSQQVKDSAKQFAYAQQIFSMSQQTNPFVYLSMMMQVPQEIHNMAMQGVPLPPDFEPYELAVKHLRTICSLNFLMFVNLEAQQLTSQREYFVVHCENEMEVFQYIKRSAWTVSSPEVASELEASYGAVSGVGMVLLLFVIPSLRKMVGVAEVASNVMAVEGSDQSIVQLRWIFIRDIPIYHIKQVNYLNNPNYRKPQASEEDGSSEDAASSSAENGEKTESKEKPTSKEEDATTAEEAAPSQDENVEAASVTEEDNEQRGYQRYDGPRCYKVPVASGNFAYDIIARFKLNGGILLDFGEYSLAEQQNRAPIQANLTCGGPRQRPTVNGTTNRGRGNRFVGNATRNGRGRGGRGRGGFGVDQRSRGTTRGRGRGRSQHDGDGSGGRGDGDHRGSVRGRGGRPQSRKVEGVDGQQTLRSQYTFEIQHKKGGKPRTKSMNASDDIAPSTTTE